MIDQLPYGSWPSPITSEWIVQESIVFYEMQAGLDALYWIELHPKQKGRLSLVRYTPQEGETLPVPNHSVRTRVHEYGGGAFCLSEKGLIFSSDEDRQLYRLSPDGHVQKLTDTPDSRYADGEGMIWVRERHGGRIDNELAKVTPQGVEVFASGHDFYASPRISSDGKRLAFLTWDFPNMPWDGSTLWLADLKDQLHSPQPLAGGRDESVCGIGWHKQALYFLSDRTGFWNLYRYASHKIEPLCPMAAEFGEAAWMFGRPTYTFWGDEQMVCKYTLEGVDHLGVLDLTTKQFTPEALPFTMIQNLVTFQDKVYFFGASPTLSSALIEYDPKTHDYVVQKESVSSSLGEEWISLPERLEFPTHDGKRGYGFYYPPKNPHVTAPSHERPPLIVKAHGGPTSRTHPIFNPQVQFWTSRGFAFLDVNYGGSTGYGREYANRLMGNWGVVDVDDCIAATELLIDQGRVDPKRIVIRGGSAGGYTAMMALIRSDLFAAATSYYGVSDLELLFDDSHKFESQYVHTLVAPYPQETALIQDRSPSAHIDKLSRPILFLQGSDDKVVPPEHTLIMYEALKKKGTPVGMLLFEGEGHGFRKAETLQRALDAEFYFYSLLFGLELPEPFASPPVIIENWHQ